MNTDTGETNTTEPAGGSPKASIADLLRGIDDRLSGSTSPQDQMAELIGTLAELRDQIAMTDAEALFGAPEAQAKWRELAAQFDLGEGVAGDAEFSKAGDALNQAKPDIAAALGGLIDLLSELSATADPGDMARALDDKTDGAFSEYRKTQDDRTMDEVAARAAAAAAASAKQAKADVDVTDFLRSIRPSPTKE